MTLDQNVVSGEATTIRVSLVLRDFEVSPSEITKELGINPTRAGQKGQPRVTTNGRVTSQVHRHSYWALTSKLPSTTPLEAQITALLDSVEVAAEALRNIASPVVKQVNCTVIPGGAIPELKLRADTMGRLANMGWDLLIDVLYIDSDEP